MADNARKDQNRAFVASMFGGRLGKKYLQAPDGSVPPQVSRITEPKYPEGYIYLGPTEPGEVKLELNVVAEVVELGRIPTTKKYYITGNGSFDNLKYIVAIADDESLMRSEWMFIADLTFEAYNVIQKELPDASPSVIDKQTIVKFLSDWFDYAGPVRYRDDPERKLIQLYIPKGSSATAVIQQKPYSRTANSKQPDQSRSTPAQIPDPPVKGKRRFKDLDDF